MSDPFIGEIRIFANTYIPDGWLPCDGSSLPIAQSNPYIPLYSIIGQRFGGSGNTSFNLPNLNGRIAIGTGPATSGTDYLLGNKSGTETVVLQRINVPAHTHQMQRKSPASITSKHPTPTQNSDVGALAVAATNTPFPMMANGTTVNTSLDSRTIGSAWGGANGAAVAHENRQPFLGLLFGIAYLGIYPVKP